MPAINFKKQFADLVESGQKRQTIRSMRKRPFKVGDTLHLFTGLRTKSTRHLGEAICTKVESIVIIHCEGCALNGDNQPQFWVDGYRLSVGLVENLAIMDGFTGEHKPKCAQLFDFFRDRVPFSGQVVHW